MKSILIVLLFLSATSFAQWKDYRLINDGKDTINRVEFDITAELKGAIDGESMAFDAVFRPSLQQYSIENVS